MEAEAAKLVGAGLAAIGSGASAIGVLVDAGIVMTTFIHAAAAAGLGCCPISSVRNHAQRISELLSDMRRRIGTPVVAQAIVNSIDPPTAARATSHQFAREWLP